MAALSCLNPTTETSLIIPPMVAESSTVAFAVAANATAVSVAIIFIFECFCISAKPFRRSLRSLSAHALHVLKVQKYANV